MKQVLASVVSNERVMTGTSRPRARALGGVWLMRLKSLEIAVEARAGQFVMVRCEGCALPRPFSIHAADFDSISILYAVWEAGQGTQWLRARRPGEMVPVFGPLGNGFSIAPAARSLLLVAGGLGIAPLAFLANEAIRLGKTPTILAGAATSEQICPATLIPRAARLAQATEDGSAGRSGLVTALIPDYMTVADQVFACGPMSMIRDMATRSKELGLAGKPVQVSLEMRMGCGVGVCFGCTIKTKHGLKQVCKDGPVFPLEDIVWDGLACV